MGARSSSNLSSKTGSNSKPKKPTILRLQKKCKKIIYDKYY